MRSMPTELARSALDAAPDAMIIIDVEGVIRFASQQAFALFGYSREDIVGHCVEILIPERFRALHVEHRNEYMVHMRARPMGQNLELYGRRRDATEFPVEISLSPISDANNTLVVAAIRDVSEQKRIQRELVAARTVAEEARAIADHARESADRANRGKSRFLATASHDLRQPLQALALLNGTLRRTAHDSKLTEALTQQEQAIGTMSRLLNALLDISKLESGAIQPELEQFPVERIFTEMHREFSSVAQRKGLTLEVAQTDAWGHSDPSLVEQVIRNLISNAIKYTGKGTVTLCCRPDGEAAVRIDVRDTGIGIASDQLSLIYDEFYQVGVGTHVSREGYGLGLSIVKRIVQLLDLKLEVVSQPGEGSTFSLLVPSAGAEASELNTPAEESAVGRPSTHEQPRVLLVEDDASVRDATQMLLKLEGFRVIPVASLDETIQTLDAGEQFDLLITDYHLGRNQTGMDVIAALRKQLGRPVKSILITGDTSAAAHQLPPDRNLRVTNKPIRAETLLGVVRELLAEKTD